MYLRWCTQKNKNQHKLFLFFGWGALPPRPPSFWLGGQSPFRPPPKRLNEAASFGRLDQMLRTTVSGRSGEALPPQPKTGGSGQQRPPAKNETLSRNRFLKKLYQEKQKTVCGSMTTSTCKSKLPKPKILNEKQSNVLFYF